MRQSLNEHLLRHLVQDSDRQTANSIRLARLLETHDCAGMKELFHAFFASIPYQWYTGNHIADYEGFYASVFYSYFAALGYDIAVEESSTPTSKRRGRLAARDGGRWCATWCCAQAVRGAGGAGAWLDADGEARMVAPCRSTRSTHSIRR